MFLFTPVGLGRSHPWEGAGRPGGGGVSGPRRPRREVHDAHGSRPRLTRDRPGQTRFARRESEIGAAEGSPTSIPPVPPPPGPPATASDRGRGRTAGTGTPRNCRPGGPWVRTASSTPLRGTYGARFPEPGGAAPDSTWGLAVALSQNPTCRAERRGGGRTAGSGPRRRTPAGAPPLPFSPDSVADSRSFCPTSVDGISPPRDRSGPEDVDSYHWSLP